MLIPETAWRNVSQGMAHNTLAEIDVNRKIFPAAKNSYEYVIAVGATVFIYKIFCDRVSLTPFFYALEFVGDLYAPEFIDDGA